MKKLIVLLFVILLFAVPAAAQEQKVTEMLWEDAKGGLDSTATRGDFVDFEEAGIRIFIPDILTQADLAEPLKNNGYLGYYKNEDHSMMVLVSKIESEDETPADFVEDMRSYIPEVSMVGLYRINGIDAAIFDDPTHDEHDCVYKVADDCLIRISVQPFSNWTAAMLSTFVFYSVQMLETEN